MKNLDEEFSEAMKASGVRLKDALCRLVYLQPNLYSDESLVVGVIIESGGKPHLDKINAVDNYQALSCLFGSDTREQTIFALEILQESVHSGGFTLSGGESPTDMLRFGPLLKAACEDEKKYARDLLTLSSSLYRNYHAKMDDFCSINQKELENSLKESIVKLNPFKGRELIKTKRFQTSNKNYIEIPIFGEKIFGAPVSMVTKVIDGAKKSAEAYIAKFKYVHDQVDKLPVIYVFAPKIMKDADRNRIEDSLGELELVGNASGVEICSEESVDDLAKAVYRYENIVV